MNVESVRLRARTSAGDLDVFLRDHLSPDIEERAAAEEIEWIKGLRHASDGRMVVRDAVTYRHDSMWWFIEIYLHKRGRVRQAFRAILAMDALFTRHRPTALTWLAGDPWMAPFVRACAQRTATELIGAPHAPTWRERARTWWHFLLWTTLAVLGRALPRRTPASAPAQERPVVGYVHSAFWRGGRPEDDTEGTESYLGPVLDALRDTGQSNLVLVGLGPQENFRSRRWWHPVAGAIEGATKRPVTAIEAFAPMARIAPSLAFALQCPAHARWLCGAHLREQARLRDLDVWPMIREELRGAALLQLPWSARAMDEAGASLDALRPSTVFTYAEAGGWGRALVLEARRRRIPTVGLQHGFIYRHWLNYRHAADEMAPSASNPADLGFPRPDRTLVYDDYAAEYLRTAGAFPPGSVEVTGSPSLDRLTSGVARLDEAARRDVRARLGVGDARVVVVVSKFSQIRVELGPLLDAAAPLRDSVVVLVPHPAETPAPYTALAAGRERTVVALSDLPLPALLAVAKLVVTVHSTVGLDALALDVPCLVVGLPTNLSPFVDAGVMAGVRTGAITTAMIRSLVDDDGPRRVLLSAAADFRVRHRMVSDGGAARRAADAISRVGVDATRVVGVS